MKVRVYAADMGGCGRYRMTYPAQAARNAGYDVTVIDSTDGQNANLRIVCKDDLRTGLPVVVDAEVPDADVVVLQRTLSCTLVQTIPFLQARGVAVVIEVDDDFDALHRDNVAARALHGNLSSNPSWLREACRIADLVTCSTPALARRYGSHGRVAVLRNLLPDAFMDATPNLSHVDRHRTWVGWSGSIGTHPTDLQVTQGAIGAALTKTGAGLYVVGEGIGVRERLHVPDDVPFTKSGWQPIDDYPGAMAAMDVGIVPLDLTPFNQAKSYLKGMEMAAVGVPFVASPTAEYQLLASMGAGLIAGKGRHWEGAVKRLITDPAFRAEMAAQGREAVQGLTYARHAHAWPDAWLQAVLHHGTRDHRREYGLANLPKIAPNLRPREQDALA